MALDAALLALCAAELKAELTNARVDKIHQPARDEVVLQLRRRDARAGGARLLMCARTGAARVCLSREVYENPPVPYSFCMLLRKHLSGARVADVRVQPCERILFIDFDCRTEMGDEVRNTFAAELMGRYCNLVLVRAGEGGARLAAPRVIDALKRVDFEDSAVRQLLPGLGYTLPPAMPGVDFLTAPVEPLMREVRAAGGTLSRALRRAACGAGPAVLREVCHRAACEGESTVEEIGPAAWGALAAAVEDIRADHAAGGRPCIVWDGASPVEFSFTPLTQYPQSFARTCYAAPREGEQESGLPPVSAMLEAYYAERDRALRMRQKSRQLVKTVQNLYERAVRRQAARMEDLAAGEDSEALRVTGELLTANLHTFAKGDAAVTVHDWYAGTERHIALDARLSPGQNAQKYFREYKRRQTAARVLSGLLLEGEREAAYLQTVLYELSAADGEAALDEIRAELSRQGYLKSYKPRDRRQRPAGFWRYVSGDGFVILAGRNNAQNERLSLKTARGKDLWFHVKDAPGSHVVVMSEGRDIPDGTRGEAAMLAVYHSGQSAGAKVAVDCTEVKNLRKTKDLPPGMVLYERYETVYITPDAAVTERLCAGAGEERL